MGHGWFVQKSEPGGSSYAVCKGMGTGEEVSQTAPSFDLYSDPDGLEKTVLKAFLPTLSLLLWVIALINIKGLNKYLQIISLTSKITKG